MPGFDMLHCIVCYGPCLHVVNYDTMHVYLLNCLTDLNKYLTCFWIFGFPSGIKKKKKNFVEDLPLNMSTKFGINWFTCLKKIEMKKFTNYDDVGR